MLVLLLLIWTFPDTARCVIVLRWFSDARSELLNSFEVRLNNVSQTSVRPSVTVAPHPLAGSHCVGLVRYCTLSLPAPISGQQDTHRDKRNHQHETRERAGADRVRDEPVHQPVAALEARAAAQEADADRRRDADVRGRADGQFRNDQPLERRRLDYLDRAVAHDRRCQRGVEPQAHEREAPAAERQRAALGDAVHAEAQVRLSRSVAGGGGARRGAYLHDHNDQCSHRERDLQAPWRRDY